MRKLKPIFILIVLLCFVISLKAQTEKGNILLGAGTNFDFNIMKSNYKTDDNSGYYEKTTSLELSPQIGFLLADGLALGTEVLLMHSAEVDEYSDYRTSSIAIAPFLRYYLGKTNVRPYFDGGVGIGNVRIKYEYSGQTGDYSSSLFLYGFGSGIGLFVNEHVSIDMGIYYRSSSTKPRDDNEYNYREVTNGIGFGIGIVVVL